MPRRRNEIEQILRSHAMEIRSFGVERIGIFGSYARDEATSASDVDLMVVFRSGTKTLESFIDLAEFLESKIGCKVDLLTPESLSGRVRERILAQVSDVPLAA